MPTYQYACTQCHHAFERVQSFNEDALTVCPQCQGRLRKVYNAVGVVFKGSGFYRNDSRSTGPDGGSGAKPSPDTSTTPAATSPSPTTTSDSSSGSASTPAAGSTSAA